MSFYYDNQTRERAESLMEKQHYPVLEEAASEDEEFCEYCGESLENGLCSASCNESADDEGREKESTCTCGHLQEDHIEYKDECCICECTEYQEDK